MQPLPRYVFTFQALVAEGNEALLQWGYPVGVGSLSENPDALPCSVHRGARPRLTDTGHIQGWVIMGPVAHGRVGTEPPRGW